MVTGNFLIKFSKSHTKQTHDNFVLLGYYAVINGNFLPTFRGNLSLSKIGQKQSRYRPGLSQRVPGRDSLGFAEHTLGTAGLHRNGRTVGIE